MKSRLPIAPLISVLCALPLAPAVHAGSHAGVFPGKGWELVADPAQAGFDAPTLASVDTLCQDTGVAALFVVRDGRVVKTYGRPERRFRLASARKSFMHAVIGIHLAEGRMQLDRTLEEMGIDDVQPFTDEEKQATLLDLTSARSGVYLPAAYETRSNAERRPERGSHAPGTFFYYNNWDFNVLSTIVEKESGEPFFETFTKRIAGPLEFEDFDPLALYLRYEPEKSQHAAYLMRLSARDMARVGVLYLHDGAWRGRQIVDADWVRRSGEHFSRMTGDFAGRGWYGHLWWAQDIAGEPAYYASGAGGQRMFVIPSRDLVVVVLFDTYGRGGGRHADTIAVATRVVEAATGDPSPSPRTSPYVGAAPTIPARHPLDDAVAKHVVGAFSNPKLGDFEFEAGDGAYVVTCGIGHFRVVPTGPHTAWAEDVECDVDFADDPQSDERQLAVSFDAQGRVDALRATW